MFQRTVARACELWIVTRVVWRRQSLSKPLRMTPQSHALRRSCSRALFCSTSTVVGQDTSSAAQKWPQQWWVNVLCGFWDYMARSIENCNWKLSLKIKAIGRKSMALACQSKTSNPFANIWSLVLNSLATICILKVGIIFSEIAIPQIDV